VMIACVFVPPPSMPRKYVSREDEIASMLIDKGVFVTGLSVVGLVNILDITYFLSNRSIAMTAQSINDRS
jgi:hypothetical protein